MIRWLIISALILGLAFPTRAEVRLTITYNEASDLFQTMDNSANWWPGFTDTRYRADWDTRFGWSKADEVWTMRYTEYRKRTFSDSSQGLDVAISPHGLFASSISNAENSDPLADYMLAQPDITTALRNFETIMSKEDAAMLRGFFAHFEPKWRVLLAESEPLTKRADELSARMSEDAVNDYIRRISHFYGTEAEGEFRVFFYALPAGQQQFGQPCIGKSTAAELAGGSVD